MKEDYRQMAVAWLQTYDLRGPQPGGRAALPSLGLQEHFNSQLANVSLDAHEGITRGSPTLT